MNKIITSTALFLTALATQAQTQEMSTDAYAKIDVSGNVELIYAEAATASIRYESQNSGVRTAIEKGTLHIVGQDEKPAKVYVKGSRLHAITASHNARVTVPAQITSDVFELNVLSGAAFIGFLNSGTSVRLHVDQNSYSNTRVNTKSLQANLAGNSRSILVGKAKTATINGSGKSLLDAGNFSFNRLQMNAQDYALAKIYAQNNTTINVAQLARVTYKGNPETVRMNENAIAHVSRPITTILANN